MAEQDRHRELRNTPGGVIANTAFDYAVKYYDFAGTKFPDLKRYLPDARTAAMQAAIIVGTLILLERKAPGGRGGALYEELAGSFPPSARYRCLGAVLDLSAFLLRVERAPGAPEVFPSYATLAALDDKALSKSIGAWLRGALTKGQVLEPADSIMCASMARNGWTSSVMIARKIEPKKG